MLPNTEKERVHKQTIDQTMISLAFVVMDFHRYTVSPETGVILLVGKYQ